MDMDSESDRYIRQTRLRELGDEGQKKLGQSVVLVVGCGALGSNLANTMVRAGIGHVRIVDRDVLELNNLQRQVLFDETDVAEGLPKAEAASRKLRKINSSVTVEGRISDLTPRNVTEAIQGVSLVLDGTDNFETRYVINDACVKHQIPWIYGGVIGTVGMTMSIVPGKGPCLRCVFPSPPPAGSMPTCESEGVLGTAPALIASIQATEAIKILSGGVPSNGITYIDLWKSSFRQMAASKDDECPTCAHGTFDFLSADNTAWTTTLCGRNAVQITPARDFEVDLDQLKLALESLGKTTYNGVLLQFQYGEFEILVFPDGRAIVKGTTGEKQARSLYARFIGG